MNKLLIACILMIGCRAGTSLADTISIPIQSHRTVDVQTLNVERGEDISPHVFEIEPSRSPLRIVFSSESSPLTLDVEKAFAADALNRKQDRSGAATVDAGGGAGPVDDDSEYRIVDSYSRYVPVKVSRDNFEQVFSGTERQAVAARAPAPVVPLKQVLRKTKVPVRKTQKLTVVPVAATTAKPTTAAATASAATDTTEATETVSIGKSGGKFGARISRHTASKAKMSETDSKTESMSKKSQ